MIKVKIGNIEVEVELLHNETARELEKAVPFEASAQTWGDEIYFSTPVARVLEPDFARELVEEGDVGYWPTGRAVCFFFGPTPMSGPGEIRPASAVTLVGKFAATRAEMRRVKDGDRVRVEGVEER